MSSHRTNFETFMLEMQHNQMMTDLKRMSQDISEALYKCQHLTKENQLYWWVSNMVMTQELGRGYVCPSMSLNQSEGSGSILFSLTGSLPPLKQDSKILTSCTHFGKVCRVCEPLKSLSFTTKYPWDRKGLHHDGNINQPWASWALKLDS